MFLIRWIARVMVCCNSVENFSVFYTIFNHNIPVTIILCLAVIGYYIIMYNLKNLSIPKNGLMWFHRFYYAIRISVFIVCCYLTYTEYHFSAEFWIYIVVMALAEIFFEIILYLKQNDNNV